MSDAPLPQLLAQLPVLAFLFLMLLGAINDVRRYIIPNWVSIAVAALFPLAALASGMGWAMFGLHLAVGFAALLLGMALFAPGWIGGGDAKLFAAGALWFGWPGAALFLGYSALAGGVLAVILVLLRKITPATTLSAEWVAKTPLAMGAPAPYGVALAAGAMAALPASLIGQALIAAV